MYRWDMRGLFVASLTTAVLASPLRADFSYQETTKIAGARGKPVTVSRAIKGNRMIESSKDHAKILDLDKATITQIDRAKKTYFIENVSQAPPPSATDVKFTINTTGQSKQIGVVTVKQMILTVPSPLMVFAELWVAIVPGYDEARSFARKLGEKLGYSFAAKLLPAANIPDSAQEVFAALLKQVAQIDGAPVQRSVRISGEGMALEFATQLSDFSSAPVEASRFEAPAGFKQTSAD
jgi:hypothetical protein